MSNSAQYFGFAYSGRFCPCHLRIKGLVRNSAGRFVLGYHRVEASDFGPAHEKNRRGAIYANLAP